MGEVFWLIWEVDFFCRVRLRACFVGGVRFVGISALVKGGYVYTLQNVTPFVLCKANAFDRRKPHAERYAKCAEKMNKM